MCEINPIRMGITWSLWCWPWYCCWCQMGPAWGFQKLLNWNFHSQPPLDFTRIVWKTQIEQRFCRRKQLVAERVQRTMARLVWADRKTMVTHNTGDPRRSAVSEIPKPACNGQRVTFFPLFWCLMWTLNKALNLHYFIHCAAATWLAEWIIEQISSVQKFLLKCRVSACVHRSVWYDTMSCYLKVFKGC